MEAVAEYRSVDVNTVLSEFGQGGVLVGAAAVAAGMADSVGTLEDLLTELNSSRSDHGSGLSPGTAGVHHVKQESTMPDDDPKPA